MKEVKGFMFRGKNGVGNTTKTKVFILEEDVLFIESFFVTKKKTRVPQWKLLYSKFGLKLYKKEIYIRKDTFFTIFKGLLDYGKE
jgi:hypothetical protein